MSPALAPSEAAFQRAETVIRARPWFTEDWICKNDVCAAPNGVACRVLKLLKAHWSDDDPRLIGNETGVFFSLWIEADDASQLHFNIHALKLRRLRKYALESRKFAEAFRRAFEPLRPQWPPHRVDFGPQTLMEGNVPWDAVPDPGELQLVNLADRFVDIAGLIDELLKSHQVIKR